MLYRCLLIKKFDRKHSGVIGPLLPVNSQFQSLMEAFTFLASSDVEDNVSLLKDGSSPPHQQCEHLEV